MQASPPRAMVTGGSGGLGAAIVANLSAAGWLVDAPSHQQLDVTDKEAVVSYLQARTLELLVCAAGVAEDALLARMKPEQWDEVWCVNFRAAANCAEAVLPGMWSRGSGHIVFISSHSAAHPPPGQAAYAAAKAALLGLTTDLSVRGGPHNVRINVVLPGFLETRMTSGVSDQRRADVLEQHALGRFNTCDAVASFIRFLHENLPHTSGQVFQLDSRPNFCG